MARLERARRWLEDFPGIVILAADLRSHLDEAFARRFRDVLHFPVPSRL